MSTPEDAIAAREALLSSFSGLDEVSGQERTVLGYGRRHTGTNVAVVVGYSEHKAEIGGMKPTLRILRVLYPLLISYGKLYVTFQFSLEITSGYPENQGTRWFRN